MKNPDLPRLPLISVVVPCYNESRGVFKCHSRLRSVLNTLSENTEVIYVDDGSDDDTLEILNAIRGQDRRVGVVSLSRNFGKEAALTAGIDHANGDAVIVIDADLQDPPECIPEMVQAWRNGYDVVAMKRVDRSSDSVFKRESAKWFYRILGRLSDVDIPSNVGDFRLLSRRATDALRSLPERNRYMKGLFAWIGFNTIELPYTRNAREEGESKWPLRKLVGLAIDGITAFSIAPLRFASVVGMVTAMCAFVYGFVFALKTVLMGEAVAGFPTLIVTMTFLGGVQLLAIGLLGEYVGRLSIESKQRPVYLVESASVPTDVRSSGVSVSRVEAIK